VQSVSHRLLLADGGRVRWDVTVVSGGRSRASGWRDGGVGHPGHRLAPRCDGLALGRGYAASTRSCRSAVTVAVGYSAPAGR